MSLQVRRIGLTDPLWAESLQAMPHDVYHTPGYLQIEAEWQQAAPEAVLVARDDCLLFVPYLVRSGGDLGPDFIDITSPSGYPGILLNNAAERDRSFVECAHDALVDSLRSRGACSAFLRLHPLLSSLPDDVTGRHAQITYGETVSVDLTLGEEQIWTSMRRNHRRTIRKCRQLGLTTRLVPYREHLSDFRAVYLETMDRVGARQSYYLDDAYFRQLADLGPHLHLAIAEAGAEVAAGLLLFECCGIVQFHLGGTKTKYMKISPSHLLMHEVRRWAKSRGNRLMHLGGGVGGSNQDQLFAFKAGFSKQRHPFRTLRYVLDPTQYRELVRRQAESLGRQDDELYASEFFPAYRATCA